MIASAAFGELEDSPETGELHWVSRANRSSVFAETVPWPIRYATMFAAYVLSSIPLLVLFLYATKPFMAGVTSGAFKA